MDAPIEIMRTALARVPMPSKGWLRAVRDAIGLNQRTVAARMAIRQQTYHQIEQREGKGDISLSSLRRAAEALDCELVYFLVPKQAVAETFAALAAAHDPHLRAVATTMELEGQGVHPSPHGPVSS
jgi:predicted DNA-binding mobile mystery protein A